MSIREIVFMIDALSEKREAESKEKISMYYGFAQNIAIAILYRMDGKEVPTLYETYPELFQDEKALDEKESNRPQAWELYKEQMLDFANLHNKKRQKEG